VREQAATAQRRALSAPRSAVYETLSMYEGSFAKITEKLFKASSWPPVEAIAPYVDYDHVFCLLYKEMYFRHIFARLAPTFEQRCASWENYCELFGVILQGNVNMQLPNLWLWEMVDEYIYQ
jgi:translation initiation factor 3 subunit L